MALIRCTAKLIKEMGLKSSDLVENQPKSPVLGQWHANLISINRRKSVLFVNDRVLVNFIVPDVPRAQIKKLDVMFRGTFQCILSDEGFAPGVVTKIMGEYSKIGFAKSNSRNVLGSMNDLALHYETSIRESGGPHSAEVPRIIARLNRMPMKSTSGYIFPIKELTKLFDLAEP